MSDRIELRGLRVRGRHGALAHEAERGQVFVVDCALELDLSAAEASDDLAVTVDYGALSSQLAAVVRNTRYDLLEALAGHLARTALAHERVEAVTVRVAKPHAPVTEDLVEAAVTVRRARA